MPILTIELDSLTERRLRERSLHEGQKKEELAALLLATSLAAFPSSDLTENQLIELINEGWNEQEWDRYHALVALKKEEHLTEAEYEELCDLTNSRELAHADRLRLALVLARLRKITLEDVIKQLGFGSQYVE